MNLDASEPDALDRVIVHEFFDHQEAIENGDATYKHYYNKLPGEGGF